MADALVFGQPNSVAARLADGLSDVLRVPVRYCPGPDEVGKPGVALCTKVTAFSAGASILVFADDVLLDAHAADADRIVALETLAEAVALGRYVAIVPDKHAAKRWLAALIETPPAERGPLRRLYIVGEAGTGKTTLAEALGETLGLPVSHLDNLFTSDPEAGHSNWREQAAELTVPQKWIIEGSYWRAAGVLVPAADATIYMDLPADVVRQRRVGGSTAPAVRPKHRALGAVRLKTQPLFESRLLRHELLAHAAERPILRVRNEAELEAVKRGLLRGAAAATGSDTNDAG
jgi:hypothetical protein